MSGLLERALPIRDDYLEIESIPPAERDQIFDEINQAIARGKLQITRESFQFSPQKKGWTFPLSVNLAALILTALLGSLLYLFYGSSEREMITERSSINYTESQIIGALREESERQLSAKELEIAKIQGAMNNLRNEQSLLLIESEKERARLEEALTEELKKQLDQEEERLIALNMNRNEINEQLQSLRVKLESEYTDQLQRALTQEEERRVQRERELEEEIARAEESLRLAEEERAGLSSDLESQLASRSAVEKEFERLSSQMETEAFLADQINASYTRIAGSLAVRDYTAATGEISALKQFYETRDFAEFPNLQSRKQTDREVLKSITSLIPSEASDIPEPVQPPNLTEATLLLENAGKLYETGELDDAAETIESALGLIPEISSAYELLMSIERARLDRERALFEGKLAEAESNRISEEDLALLAAARSASLSRSNLIDRIDELSFLLDEIQEGLPYARNEEDLLELVSKKVLLKEALASEAVRKEYPDLYSSLDEYMDTYGTIHESIGKTTALEETASLMEALLLEQSHLPSPDDPEQKELYQSILSNLSKFITSPEQ